jgi:DNA-binding NarL/FixJ family response regulator
LVTAGSLPARIRKETAMNIQTPIPVAIIHVDPLVRACMATALGERPEFALRAVMQDALECMQAHVNLGCGVIVADHHAAASLTNAALHPRLVSPSQPLIAVVSCCDREWELRSALERRARGYLSPGFDAQQLVDCVIAVHGGSRYLCPRSAARLAESLSYETLTERETAVIRLVVKGLPNKSVGRELDISVGTVKSHLKSAYAKLEVTSRTQAIAEAQRRGLLQVALEPVAGKASARNATLQPLMPQARFSWLSVAGELRAA